MYRSMYGTEAEKRPTWGSVRSVYGGWVRTDPRGGVLGRCTEAG